MSPAPESTPRRPVLGHVNLMADTLIANANLDDLRAIVRSMVASATPGIAAALTAAARDRLQQTNARCLAFPDPGALFTTPCATTASCGPAPTPLLYDLLKRARALYGSGMGFASLGLLTTAVRATLELRWDREGEMADVLAVIDADIAQAIQSCKEEVESGRVPSSPSSSSYNTYEDDPPTPPPSPPSSAHPDDDLLASSHSLSSSPSSYGIYVPTYAKTESFTKERTHAADSGYKTYKPDAYKTTPRAALLELRSVLDASHAVVAGWGGEFAFERARGGVEFWGV
ncbi:hypothetical protein C8R44DRAFT_992212 [Mycena epipterygia]|nr:hypothetical protein C8R44DRAFT_992212 [Mycena epipterygia]